MPVVSARRTAWRTPWLARVSVLALCAGLMTLAPAGVLHAETTPAVTTTATTATAATPVANSAHPYSLPIWSPLRAPATITCVKTNCTGSGGDYHGYWAIDFVGHRGDPVHAAGAGVFHVGARSATCAPTGSQTDGVWGWVDHGGGRVSKYTHLDSIAVAEGALVTPATMIGRMGHWGDAYPCTTNYLHFEVRDGGIKGTRIDPATLRACTPSAAVDMPRNFNGTNSFDTLAKAAFSTPTSSSACVTDVWNDTPAQPTLTATRGRSSAILKWGTPPAGNTWVRVTTSLYSPSLKAWNAPTYRTYWGSPTGTTITGLTNGRTYRFQVSFRNSAGSSAWSTAKSVIPATVPSVPVAPRFLTSPTPSYIHYGWWKSSANGAAVTKYTTQVRCYSYDRWLAWTSRTTNASTYYYNHYSGVSGHTKCQVRVNATNGMGTSAWSKVSSITKKA